MVRIPDKRGHTVGHALCFCKDNALVSKPKIVLDLREAKCNKMDAEKLANDINVALAASNFKKIITLLATSFAHDTVT